MSRMTLLTGPERRLPWSEAVQEQILVAAFSLGAVVADVARQFRGIALGRCSWLFCGSDRGGHRAAAMAKWNRRTT